VLVTRSLSDPASLWFRASSNPSQATLSWAPFQGLLSLDGASLTSNARAASVTCACEVQASATGAPEGQFGASPQRRALGPLAATVTTGDAFLCSQPVPTAHATPVITTGADTYTDGMLAAADIAAPHRALAAALASYHAAILPGQPAQTVTTGVAPPPRGLNWAARTGASMQENGSATAATVAGPRTITTGCVDASLQRHGSDLKSPPGSARASNLGVFCGSVTCGGVGERLPLAGFGGSSPLAQDASATSALVHTPPTITTGAHPTPHSLSSPVLERYASRSAPSSRISSPTSRTQRAAQAASAVPRLPLHTITTGSKDMGDVSLRFPSSVGMSPLRRNSHSMSTMDSLSSLSSSPPASLVTVTSGVVAPPTNTVTPTHHASIDTHPAAPSSAHHLPIAAHKVSHSRTLHTRHALSLSALLSPRFSVRPTESTLERSRTYAVPHSPSLSSRDLLWTPRSARMSKCCTSSPSGRRTLAALPPSADGRTSPAPDSPAFPAHPSTASLLTSTSCDQHSLAFPPTGASSPLSIDRGTGLLSLTDSQVTTTHAGTMRFTDSMPWDLSAPSSFSSTHGSTTSFAATAANGIVNTRPIMPAPQSNACRASVLTKQRQLLPLAISTGAPPATSASSSPAHQPVPQKTPGSPVLSSLHSTPRSYASPAVSPREEVARAGGVRMFSNPAASQTSWDWQKDDNVSFVHPSSNGLLMMTANPAADGAEDSLSCGNITLQPQPPAVITGTRCDNPHGPDIDSLEDTVSFSMPDVSNACRSISMARLPNTDTGVARLGGGTPVPAEPRIPHKVGFSGAKECTLDFALGGAAAAAGTKGAPVEGANVLFRRWEVEKALREEQGMAPADDSMGSGVSSGYERAGVEASLQVPVAPGRQASSAMMSGSQNIPALSSTSCDSTCQRTLSSAHSLPIAHIEPHDDCSDEIGHGANSAALLGDSELGGVSTLSVAEPQCPRETPGTEHSLTAPESMMSSMGSLVKWVDNEVAPDWRFNPLGEDRSHDQFHSHESCHSPPEVSTCQPAMTRLLSSSPVEHSWKLGGACGGA
jgi:hypothetical protein